MYKRMLVPLDGSELAEVVFTLAKELAVRLDVEVVLLLVANPSLREFIPMHQAYIERAAKIIRRQAREVEKRIGIQSRGKTVEIRGELAVGYPAEEILHYADENDVDLILMATHGRSGRKRWVMGSVADKILKASKVPVLLVRAGILDEVAYDKWPRITILVPLDESEFAEMVLPYVEALAKQRGNELVDVVLIRVCEPSVTPSYYTPELSEVPVDWGQYAQQEAARRKQVASEYLTRGEKQFRDNKIKVSSEVLVGRAADQIVNYANEHPFNIIVMATHGRSGLSRWVYGSVAEYVLTEVSSPVLLVRPQQSV
ncbi:universal stress protein [Chloroflexota bacterium]